MGLWQTGLASARTRLDKLDRQLGNLDGVIDAAEWQLLERHDDTLSGRMARLDAALREAGLDPAHMRTLGTLGGGNHFAELQAIDQVQCPDPLTRVGLQAGHLQLLVHSGSRGLGQAILRAHVDVHGHVGLADDSPAAQSYLRQHDAAVQFAELNRMLIAARILRRLHADGAMVLDVNHNTVAPAIDAGLHGWLHRKGATPADRGLVMLPGSRDDHSYLLQPLAATGEPALQSLAHGAGRKWQRGDCKGRLQRVATSAQLSRTGLGGRVICNDRALIYEEAPQAYKNVSSVLDCLVGAGLARVISRSRPVLTYKTRGECC